MHLAFLDIPQTTFSPAKRGVESFWTLASELGHRLEVPTKWEDFIPLIRRADGMILPGGFHLRSREIFEALRARVLSGVRMLVCAGEHDAEQLNALLAHFELYVADVHLRAVGPNPYVVRIRRSPDTFRDERIFHGVEEVTVLQPSAIWCRGNSRALLVPALDTLALEEGSIEQSRIEPRERPCMGMWEGEGRAAVVLVAGNILGDPYYGPGGMSFPGIGANRELVSNILSFISEPVTRKAGSS